MSKESEHLLRVIGRFPLQPFPAGQWVTMFESEIRTIFNGEQGNWRVMSFLNKELIFAHNAAKITYVIGLLRGLSMGWGNQLQSLTEFPPL